MDHTVFFGSQFGGESVINYSYTDMPLRLLMYDIKYFFVFMWALPWILWPIRPTDGGPFDELSPTLPNAWCVFIHILLVIWQVAFIMAIPSAILFPVWMVAIGLGLFLGVNKLLCLALNGKTDTYESDPKYAPPLEEHAHEKWIFLNGVAVGEAWMLSNLNRLALTFKRPVTGIHNKTNGIIFDVVECLIQRNFSYATGDVRLAYKAVKEHLYNPQYSKVVFILHSQGGIEGGLVLDWLLQELPQDLLTKLEVYTFGCAANHFNNPHRHAASQDAEKNHLHTATATSVTKMQITDSPTELKTPLPRRQTSDDNHRSQQPVENPPTPESLSDDETTQTETSQLVLPAMDRAIGYIEHYAHTTDFVALWGVLHFVTNKRASPMAPRFIGRVFSRTSSRGGHQFCQHYLNGMFPLECHPSNSTEFIGCADENDFMNSVVERGEEGTARQEAREAYEDSWDMLQRAGRKVKGKGSIHEVAVHGSFTDGRLEGDGKIRVKDLSRLWLYRNGRSPPETPRGLEADKSKSATPRHTILDP
ncbi:uncharacterized protein BCR38DRAFT_459908 [Pseudomassariella vexata]|uniref:Alpha/Beta hydrolase protein n=1 Tax=Pseudomassariella vexata TaxID=1141098 RepID=A0A1Y2DNW8_9PEZI|nr:uncharacterized protein BCR38DRAFT_459908 [Pseudomassariella vexata]ORY60981.1 hypothetical protein BCR38DRAFT_459908 [Pseudomassariella vexata]